MRRFEFENETEDDYLKDILFFATTEAYRLKHYTKNINVLKDNLVNYIYDIKYIISCMYHGKNEIEVNFTWSKDIYYYIIHVVYDTLRTYRITNWCREKPIHITNGEEDDDKLIDISFKCVQGSGWIVEPNINIAHCEILQIYTKDLNIDIENVLIHKGAILHEYNLGYYIGLILDKRVPWLHLEEMPLGFEYNITELVKRMHQTRHGIFLLHESLLFPHWGDFNK